MPYTTINKSTDHFNTKLYSGTGSAQSITGVGFQPDLTWIKSRGATSATRVLDAVRGATKVIFTSEPDVESTNAQSLTSFDSDGFSVGTHNSVNQNGYAICSWNWKANGAGSSNSDGSITSTVSANQTAGISIVKWVGTGANGTIGHGLNAVPKLVIVKCLDAGVNWFIYHQATGNTKEHYLNGSTAAYSGTTAWNSTTPTSSVVHLGAHNAGANKSGDDQIAYCFAEKPGFSRFGSFYGNANIDGAFVHTGFKPALVIMKNQNDSDHWSIVDNKRIGFNERNYWLYPNLTNSEYGDNESSHTAYHIDLLSNGFKIRSTDNMVNGSGDQIIYIAFAEAPLVGSNDIPSTAR